MRLTRSGVSQQYPLRLLHRVRGGQPHDVNLASLYHIRVNGTYKEDGKDILVTVDASKATRPDGYPFTVEQLIEAVVTCVKIMYPQRPPDEGAFDISVTRPAATK